MNILHTTYILKIDVRVFYSQEALDKAGVGADDMNDMIEQSMNSSNKVSTSGIIDDLELKLVKTMQVMSNISG